jgi:hypothetical protein
MGSTHPKLYDPPAPRSGCCSKKTWVRLLILVLPIIIAIDAAPRTVPGIDFLQYHLTPPLRFLGLWQGRWTLFAPNPVINNGWISAEIYGVQKLNDQGYMEKETLTWNSPYWNRYSSWEKFYRFRHVNYYNRLPYREQEAANDFAEYLYRQLASPPVQAVSVGAPLRRAGEPATGIEWEAAGIPANSVEVHLYLNNLNIIMPDDGTLPLHDEETWMSVSRNLTIRKIQP